MTWFHHNLEAFSFALLSILFEGVPFLLLGSIISGIVDVFVSSERVSKMIPKNPVAAVLTAGLLGVIFPICECGSTVVVRRFVKKGLPLGPAIAYMFAAPIVSPIVALSTYKAFSNPLGGGSDSGLALTMMGLRAGLGFTVAVIVALIVQRLPAKRIVQPGLFSNPEPQRRRTGLRTSLSAGAGGDAAAAATGPDFATVVAQASVGKKLLLAAQSAVADFIDVAFFFVIGACLASLFVGFKESIITPVATAPYLSVVALMGLATLLCLCSTTDAFVAATAFSNFSIGANLGFLVFGPMFDFKLLWLYGIIFKRRFVLLLAGGMFLVVSFLCWQIGSVDRWQFNRVPSRAAAPLPLEKSPTPLPSHP